MKADEKFNQLDELFYYKNKLMEDLLTNRKIVSLIDEDLDFKDAKSLRYKQVFPCELIPDTVEEGKTFVFFDVDIQRAINKTYLSPIIYVWVIVHKSKLRLPNGGVRTDALCARIADAINGSRRYGLGELELNSVKRFVPLTGYYGKVMTFYATDYNRLHNPNKPVPTNRKRG